MEFVSAIISPIVESLIVPVKKQLGYLFYSTKHVRNMNAKMKLLDGTSTDVKKQVDANNIRNLEIPDRVPGWLEDVEKIEKDAQSISSTRNGCFDIKMRYRAGKKAFNITEEMGALIDENSKIIWTNARKPLGKVNSKIASTSAPSHSDAQNHFKSRENLFKDALESLQQDHTSKVIALCGMGGVGKTTLMEQLKKTVEDKNMFDYVVKVVIGQQVNMLSIQQTVAEYMGLSLTELSVAARADHLRITCGKMSEGNKKVLVILDDVWETIELKDIGLSPLPNGFKLLLTSRKEHICKQIAEKANLVCRTFQVNVMEKLEAQNFFWQIVGVSKQYDQMLNKIGSDIVKRCGFLPLAINLIATTLKFQEAFAWRDTLKRLEKSNLDYVQESIEISYNYIKEEEEKVIFHLCGLFPDDFNIPIEELTRYAWGLKLLSEVSTLGEARDRTKTCVQNLRSANLLIDSDYIGCVKMHDLVLDFVLGRVSKGDHPWVINHGDLSKWSTPGMSESCKSISITCKGMFEFPEDFRYPNASLLRLTGGDSSLRFSEAFYEKMKNLEVIAYEKMQYPLLPRSLQCSTKLRTLILHQCLLMFDYSAVGELLSLEVLSFGHCGIRKLSAAIGKLKKLKLLDLTGCVDLRIDDGALINLVKLEELYMRVDKKAIRFTDGNRDELEECSKHLSALEVEFFEDNGIPKNMMFTELERFRISVGRSLEGNTVKNLHSFENTLKLVTNKDELLDSRINELFGKTEVLHLEVDGLNVLEEVLLESFHLPQQSFNNLRVLNVFKCKNLRYLFTVHVASGLMKLEHLTVSTCPVLEVLVYGENGGDGVIKFQGLKFLSLDGLPKLIAFSNIVNVIELPQLVELTLDDLPNFTSIYPTSVTSSMSSDISAIQPFFNKEVLIPKLEILMIWRMNKLKEIWPCQISSSDEVNACMLRKIEVRACDSIVNLFPRNPMSLLCHLEELYVSECGSIEVLFNIDMSCVGQIEEYSSNLRHIKVYGLGKLRELWRMTGTGSSYDILIRSFQVVEEIEIHECQSFTNVFKPTIAKSSMRTLMNVSIDGSRPWEDNVKLDQNSKEIDVISKGEISEVYGDISDVGFSSHPIPITLNYLYIHDCKDVEVVFEIESSSSSSTSTELTTTRHNHDQPLLLLPHLKRLDLREMERMSDVWKCNWNKLVIPQNQSQSSFHNLTSILLYKCHSIKYLFSPLMGKLLPNLKEVNIWNCDGIEEVVSDRDVDENEEMGTSISTPHTNTISFPLLETLNLRFLRSLKSIDGGNARGRSRSAAITTTSIHHHFKVSVASWFLSQYTKRINIWNCPVLSRVFPSDVEGQLHKLEELRISNCKSMVEVFEREEGNSDGVESSNKVGDGSDDTCTTMTIPRSANRIVHNLPNLTILEVVNCERLKYIFSSSTLESLRNLKELYVEKCEGMQVIVKEDGEHTADASKTIVFPCLKSLTLADLPNVKGFFLGMNEFRWPLLEKVMMYGCPQMVMFTSGHSMAPKLNCLHTGFGKHSLECGLNFPLTNATHEAEAEVEGEVQTKAKVVAKAKAGQVQADAKRKAKGKAKVLQAEVELQAEADSEAKAVHTEAEVQTKADVVAKAKAVQAQADAKAKTKGKAKALPEEAEVKAEVQTKAEADAEAKAVQTEVEAEVEEKAVQVQAEAQAQAQAQSLFSQFVEISDDADPELHKIGEDIVRKCSSLPVAIKTMALTLKNKSKDAWKDALSRLEHLDITTVAPTVFEMSYDNLHDEATKSIFLLCGLFPQDFAIHIEELVRYGWGLKVFDGVYTIKEARIKLNTCIRRLIHANLLIEGDDEGCVKMHNLVRAFVLVMFSKVEHASIVDHGGMSEWPESCMSNSCQRISLAREALSEFPRDIKFPNLTILKLMHGDKSLRFRPDFYAEMKMLQVISYDEMKYPLLPSSQFQCFNLRVLHLHKCSLTFDFSSIGNLLNLEVLSFADSVIEWLPSTMRNLVKLRLLDLTGCVGLRIDTGVLTNMVELEELYTIAGSQYGKAISFTDDNCSGIAERSSNLSTLEFEFFRNNAKLKDMSFENLERFKISVGRSLDGDFSKTRNSYENTLQMVIDIREFFDSEVNVLIERTEVLHLSVGDMNCLPGSCSFNNVRVLVVSRCEELRYVFSLGVAKALSQLEHLQVSLCDSMEQLIHIDGSGEETVTFPKLKFLSLVWLQNLSGLCDNDNIIELPQLVTLELDGIPNFRSIYPKNELATSCLLKKEVVIPKLEKLIICNMENLIEIWPHEFRQTVELKLRDIEVGGCDNLVTLFPRNPMSLLHHLRELKVKNCGSVEVLFNINLDFGSEIENGGSSNLRSILVKKLGKLKDVWKIRGENNSHLLIRGFEAVESLQIERCKSFRNVFAPTTINFDLGSLINMSISDFGENGRNYESSDCSEDEESNSISKEDRSQEVGDSISNVVFPSSLIQSSPNLRKLTLSDYKRGGVVFEIESPTSREPATTQDYQHGLLPYLENLDITHMERVSHLWKCNWNKFLFQQAQQSEALFHNLTTIYVKDCESIKYLFSPLMVKLLSNLKKVQIEDCNGIEEVVSKRDDEDEENMSTSTETNSTLYPCLDSLTLSFLPNLKCIGGGANLGNNELSFENTTLTANFLDQSKFSQVHSVSWPIYQYSSEISISYCDALSSVIPCYSLGQMKKLQVLRITRCDSMKEVFESQWINDDSGCGCSNNSNDKGNGATPEIPGLNHVIVLQIPMLRVLEIKDCDLVEHIFTFSTLQSLLSLEELIIWDCKALKVIVKEEHGEKSQQTTASECVVFPSLKSISLVNLPNLVGFFLGMSAFQWPSLDKVMIKYCPQMRVFAPGGSTAPMLKHIHTDLGKHTLDEPGLNFHLTTPAYHQTPGTSLEATSSFPATAEGISRSFHNLIELDVKSNFSVERIIPSSDLLHLQNLEKIHVSYCHGVDEVFEALEGTSSGLDELQTVVKLPNLTEVKLAWLDRLRNMWNTNHWTVFEFRNLKTVSIHGCHKLEHVFTTSMVGCLLQLRELHIRNCDHVGEIIVKGANVVVEEEESDSKLNEIELPCLRSLVIDQLPCLEGFCLWKADFSFPLLDTLKINRCQRLTIFTKGNLATPELREIETSFGSFYVAGEDINSFIEIKQQEFKSNRRIM